MPTADNKWIRSLKENPAGKVVEEPNGTRWEWDNRDSDETSRLLQMLQNDELAIEQTDLLPVRGSSKSGKSIERDARGRPPKPKKSSRDAGGGFNPYDNTGKPFRRR
jgi:hypothetical protein